MSEFIRKRQEVAAEQVHRPENLQKVLVLYTGGTIGMKWDKVIGYHPTQDYLESKIRTYPMLNDEDYSIPDDELQELQPFKPLVLPLTLNNYRIIYCLHEYNPLLDSSSMSMEDWAQIATDISKYYQKFNAFVILHGTDTMCYTASALSFMCEDLGKTVILTGSQVPLSELRNDGRDNLLGALVVAGEHIIPEVTVYFHNRLYRGNRSTKMNSASLEPFQSPNLPPLATVGVDISIDWDAIYRPMNTERFHVRTEMCHNVGILRIFPGITPATVRAFLQPPMQGVVLQTFGAGNIPDTNTFLLEELQAATERDMVIINCSQCTSGLVTENYAAGRKLREHGVLAGADMTTEAALTKLSFLLGRKDLSVQKVRQHMTKNLRGELTVLDSNQHQFSLRDSGFLQELAGTLHLSSSKEVRLVRNALFPPLMCTAAAIGDNDTLKMLHQQGGNFNIPDYDGRTPLHLACCEGHLETVRYLLHSGASVHVKDRFSHNPLYDAVRFKRFDVIQLMVQTGAHLTQTSHEITALIQQAACENDTDALRAWLMAGAKISVTDSNGVPLQKLKELLSNNGSSV